MRLFALSCFLGLTSFSMAAVTVEKVDYKGWTGSYKISNGTVEVIVVPQVGRVMSYGYSGEKNVLWQNDALLGKTFHASRDPYRNYGGDKLWIAPRTLWQWPPDMAFDGSPWTAKPLPNGVEIESAVGSPVQVQLRRQITLGDFRTEVTFLNSLFNRAERKEVGLWQATQIVPPDGTTLDITGGWYGFGNQNLSDPGEVLSGSTINLQPLAGRVRKLGSTTQAGRLSAVIGNVKFFSESPTVRGGQYPDHNSAQQISYPANPDPYVEFSQLGLLQRLEHSEASQQTVKWRLERG